MSIRLNQSHVLGLARIGANREMKKSVERYWRKEISITELQQIGQQIENKNWQMQIEAGLDFVTVGDFSWYNHVLDLLHNQIDALRLWFFDKTKVKLEQIKEETNERFRRLTGVKQSTFDVLVVVLEKAELLLKSQGGKPNKLPIENGLLMTFRVFT